MKLLTEAISLGVALWRSDAWSGDLKEQTLAQRFESFLLARKVEAAAKKRKESARDLILPDVKKTGDKDDTGSFTLVLEDGTATATRKVTATPDVLKVRKLLDEKKLDVKEAIVKKVVTEEVVDVSVLDGLVKTGALSQTDVDACYTVTFAFNATESKDAKKVLSDV
jgi:hypothetical protein